jgi:hypothetical protein
MKTVIWICCLVVYFQSLPAQYYYYNNKFYGNDLTLELGGSTGIMNCLTDLGGKQGQGRNFLKDLNWRNSKRCYSLVALALYKYAIGIRLESFFGSVQAADSILKPVAAFTSGRYERNLSFKSKITDLQLVLEVHPLFFKLYDENRSPRLSPFLTGGIAVFWFDPRAMLNGKWYSLQPLHTEGQGFREYPGRSEYKLIQVNFPVGMGVKYEMGPFLNARLEFLFRVLQTDYLDDVSTRYINEDLFDTYLSPSLAALAHQLHDRAGELTATHVRTPGIERGNPDRNDAFLSIQVKIGITVGRRRR